jgi:hypothetical protein
MTIMMVSMPERQNDFPIPFSEGTKVALRSFPQLSESGDNPEVL